MVITSLTIAHISLLHMEGSSSPVGIENRDYINFYPYFYVKDILSIVIILLISYHSFTLIHEEMLGESLNYALRKSTKIIKRNKLIEEFKLVQGYELISDYKIIHPYDKNPIRISGPRSFKNTFRTTDRQMPNWLAGSHAPLRFFFLTRIAIL